MNRLSTILFFIVACSSSVAQEAQVQRVPISVPPVAKKSAPSVVTEPEQHLVVIPEADRTRENAILMARVAINENSRPLRALNDKGTAGAPTEDAKALIQEMVSFAAWRQVSLKQAIRWQSKYVTGVKKPKAGRSHVWTSTLPATGNVAPSGWVECPKGQPPKDCDGRWAAYASNWEVFREWMVSQVLDGTIEAPCDGSPITWGGDMDDSIAIARGLCVIEGCGDRNTWWAFPGQGCAEPMRDVLARERPTKPTAHNPMVSAREIMKALRKRNPT